MALTFTPFADLGQALPDFELPDVFGKSFSSAEIKPSTPVVVMFICNHCPYVQAIEQRLIQLGNDLKKYHVPVIAICSNDAISHPEDAVDKLRQRFQEKNYSFTYLHDETQDVAKKFGAVCTPDFFVYDKNHRLAYRGRLDDNWKDETKVTTRELYNAVVKLAQGETDVLTQTASMGCSIKWL